MRSSLAEHREVKDYSEVYKPVILFFALIDQMFALCFSKHVTQPTTSDQELASEWTSALADWIRHNDDLVLKSMAKVLSTFQVLFLKMIGSATWYLEQAVNTNVHT